MDEPVPAESRPELFFGLISPMGVGGGGVTSALTAALDHVGYGVQVIRLIHELARLKPRDQAVDELRKIDQLGEHSDEYERYRRSIEAGDAFSSVLGPSAFAALAVARTQEIRRKAWSRHDPKRDPALAQFLPLSSTAYLYRSLKRPDEVDRLRLVYGNSFTLISAFAPRESRVESLARKCSTPAEARDPDRARARAEELIDLDNKEEGIAYGQNVGATFDKADVFVDASRNRSEIVAELSRFINLLFGYQFHTPRRDEEGMAIAHLAQLSSAHLGRQVGAAIMAPDGSVVATGCNDVPRAGGGRYRAGEDPDHRDFQLRRNTSREIRQEILGDLLSVLKKMDWLAAEPSKELERRFESFVNSLRKHPDLMNARIMDAIEYDRSVHAEMAAMSNAARLGIPLQDCTLYCTTFPCHNCARHIVHSGIKRVVFIHPYEKSLAKRLHGDAIGVGLAPGVEDFRVRFDAFVGIAPSIYVDLFTSLEREGKGDRWSLIAEWSPGEATPRRQREAFLYRRYEESAATGFVGLLKKNSLEAPWLVAE